MAETFGAGVGRTRFFLFLLCMLSFAAAACRAPGSSESYPTTEVSFTSPSGKGTEAFVVEVVATEVDRAEGLMFRKQINEHSGMLFVFPDEQVRSFWMKNTFIPLDMVFVSAKQEVVGVLENVPPLTEQPRSVLLPSTYVVEFAAGTVKRHGLGVGWQLAFKGLKPTDVR